LQAAGKLCLQQLKLRDTHMPLHTYVHARGGLLAAANPHQVSHP